MWCLWDCVSPPAPVPTSFFRVPAPSSPRPAAVLAPSPCVPLCASRGLNDPLRPHSVVRCVLTILPLPACPLPPPPCPSCLPRALLAAPCVLFARRPPSTYSLGSARTAADGPASGLAGPMGSGAAGEGAPRAASGPIGIVQSGLIQTSVHRLSMRIGGVSIMKILYYGPRDLER